MFGVDWSELLDIERQQGLDNLLSIGEHVVYFCGRSRSRKLKSFQDSGELVISELGDW